MQKVDPSDAELTLECFTMLNRNKKEIHDGVISAELAFKAIDGIGLKEDSLSSCLSAYGVKLDEEAFAKKIEQVKKTSKELSRLSNKFDLITVDVEKTDDSWKYDYNNSIKSKDETKYIFPSVQAQVLDIVTLEKDPGRLANVGVILNRTCCYGEAGGQIGKGNRNFSNHQITLLGQFLKISSNGSKI